MADTADSATDSILVSRVAVYDDRAAFSALVRRHQSAVRQFLRRLARPDWSRADDLAQETFWKAYLHINTYEGKGRFLSWLFRIAYQLYVTEQRRIGGWAPTALPEDLADEAQTAPSDDITFDQLMNDLRPEERVAVVMHYRHDLSHVEIASALGVPIGTVKSLIRRARLKLRSVHGNSTRNSNDES
jgi:RNA polymerase sigma-70 factor, ECF subfamily